MSALHVNAVTYSWGAWEVQTVLPLHKRLTSTGILFVCFTIKNHGDMTYLARHGATSIASMCRSGCAPADSFRTCRHIPAPGIWGSTSASRLEVHTIRLLDLQPPYFNKRMQTRVE